MKLKLNDILQLDLDKKGNELLLRKALTKTPFFKNSNPEDLGVEDLEKIVKKIRKKYPVTISYIMLGPLDENFYSFSLKENEEHKHIGTIYGRTLFEGFAKSILLLYSYIKNNYRKEEDDES